MNKGAIMPLEGKVAGVDRGERYAIRRQSIRGG